MKSPPGGSARTRKLLGLLGVMDAAALGRGARSVPQVAPELESQEPRGRGAGVRGPRSCGLRSRVQARASGLGGDVPGPLLLQEGALGFSRPGARTQTCRSLKDAGQGSRTPGSDTPNASGSGMGAPGLRGRRRRRIWGGENQVPDVGRGAAARGFPSPWPPLGLTSCSRPLRGEGPPSGTPSRKGLSPPPPALHARGRAGPTAGRRPHSRPGGLLPFAAGARQA